LLEVAAAQVPGLTLLVVQVAQIPVAVVVAVHITNHTTKAVTVAVELLFYAGLHQYNK
jgi:hypothetical protein